MRGIGLDPTGFATIPATVHVSIVFPSPTRSFERLSNFVDKKLVGE
jgi:hypothetical protein